jgi:hypothetical protein
MSDDLSHDGRSVLFLAAARKSDRRGKRAYRGGETPAAI